MSALDNLKKEAKRWLKALHDGDADARDRLIRACPDAAAAPVLREVQHALAREHGFDDWRSLKDRLGGPAPAGRVETPRERIDTFLEFACWDHHTHGKADHRMHDRAAQRILAQYPEIARHSIHTATVCGNLDEVRRLVDGDPEAARKAGGSRGWTPILYLAYTRFTHPATLAKAVKIAALLLDRGANPNDFYKAGDSDYSALVGAAGEGEQDSPRQPYAAELYKLLLDRGAGPYDIQVLYNTHFTCDMVWWLELTYQRSLELGRKADWDDPDWHMLDMGGYGPGAYFVLNAAISKNRIDVAEWALAHGASPGLPRGYTHPKFAPKGSLEQMARLLGRDAFSDLLVRHGAVRTNVQLEGEYAFIDACMRLDRATAAAMIREHPEYRSAPLPMFEAAKRDRPDVLQFLLDLGVPIDIADKTNARPLHYAAAHNSLRAAQFLIDHGAEIDPREASWGGAPIGWAGHGDHQEMLTLLSRYSRNVWTLAFRGFEERLREVLREEPDLAKQVSPAGITPLWWLPDDDTKAMAIVELLLAAGADPSIKSRDGHTAADWAWKRGMTDIAQRLAVGNTAPSWDADPPDSTPDYAKLDGLAHDLLFAFETGNAESLGRLMDYAGRELTWEDVRTLAREHVKQLDPEDRPEGYFSLDHARLLIARRAGFTDWSALEASFREKGEDV